MEDSEIVELFWLRDQSAVRETEAKYGGTLRRMAEHILKDRLDAEECLSDTLMKAWENIPPQRPQHLLAYLMKICRFSAFGRLDWKQAQKRQADIVELTAELEACIPNPRDGCELEGAELGALLNTFLRRLPDESRRVFIRRYWFTDSIRTIAQQYQLSESKVKVLLFRTRKQLKSYLKEEGVRL